MTPPPPPPPLDYRPPEPPRHNLWWKFLLRMILGTLAGTVSVLAGAALSSINQHLFYLVPGAVFAGLIFVAVKFRRFGYVTGFILAPFLIAACLVVYLMIVCGVFSGHPA